MVRDGGWEWTAPEQGPGGNCQGHEELALQGPHTDSQEAEGPSACVG